MRMFTRLLFLLLSCNLVFSSSFGQTTISNETFPNSFNTGFSRPINTTFQGSIGTWGAYSSDNYSTIVVNNAYYQSAPYALKLVNYKTNSCSNVSYCKATSPTVNCGNIGCVTSVNLSFKLYTYNVSKYNTYFNFYAEISKDNGSTWTTIFTKSAKDIYTTYGPNTWNTISLSIPSQFYNSSFKYRFRGSQNPGCNYDNYLYIDDVKIITQPCPVAKLKLGNQVWNDFDGDGKRDPNEPSIGGAPISLYTDNNSDNLPDGAAIKTTMTDSTGRYLFTDLPAGRYIASMPILPGYQQSPNNSTQAYSPYPDLNTNDTNKLVRLVGPNGPGGVVYTNAITLSAGGEPTNDGDDANGNLTFDLAECGNSYIGDFVWNDLNGNGIQDAGEPGINGVLVTILFPDGRTASTSTLNYNAGNNPNGPQFDGYYNFPNLGPGTYKITFATPAGLNPSPANQGGNDGKDSDPVNGGAVSVTIAANQSDFTIDAGFTNVVAPIKLSLGNLVWNDLNNNGKKESGEPGLAGWSVMLFKDADANNIVDGQAIAAATTASDGTYSFNNLESGNYIVAITLQGSFIQGSVGSSTPNDNIDNDNNGIGTYQTYVYSRYITLSPGDEPVNDGNDNNSNFTLDFGVTCHTACHNDCTHNCSHPNCGHNSCKNDCTHTCSHPNCGHNSCKNDCTHTCSHPNCGHNSCKNDCTHTCSHPNCGHNSCKNDCTHTCSHPNCGHNSCKNDCTHTCSHPNCGHNSCKNNCTHNCSHPNCGHNSCKNDCTHNCTHPNCGHNSCKNNCTHNCSHSNCGHNSCKNDCTHNCSHPNCGHNSCKNNCLHFFCGHSNCKKSWFRSSAGTDPSASETITEVQPVSTVPVNAQTAQLEPSAGLPASGVTAATAPATLATGKTVPVAAVNNAKLPNFGEATKSVLSVYPNPATNYVVINLNAVKEGTAVIRVLDAAGKLALTQKTKVLLGKNNVTFNGLNRLRSGTYIIQLLLNGEVFNKQLVIAK